MNSRVGNNPFMTSQALVDLPLRADHIAVHLIVRLAIGNVPGMFNDGILVGFADVSGVAHCDTVWWLLQVHDFPVTMGLLFDNMLVDDNGDCLF